MIQYQKTNRLSDVILTRNMLRYLDNYYPDFGYWFTNTCAPGILIAEPTDLLLVAKDHNQIIGVALGKKTVEETKLRCVRVLPEFQQRGIGIKLVEKMLRELDDDKPHCTVAEEMIHQFSRPFINLFNFNLSEVDKGRYRKDKLEYIFNA